MNRKGYIGSIVFADSALSTPDSKEENEEEAKTVVEMLKALIDEGKSPHSIAVITPYRKQVRLIRAKAKIIISSEGTPLIDTVERLQGQDVDCIILSFATSDDTYLNTVQEFLFDLNRLNVMISRAKTKVVIFGCERIQKEVKNIIGEF